LARGGGDRSDSRRFLPADPRVAEPYRLTPQLALRIGVLGAIVLALFAILFLRLWALQVLSGTQYLNAAQNNQLREIRIQPPRGAILDRNGRVLVRNTAGNSVQIWPADLPERGRWQLLQRLGELLNVSPTELARELEKRKGDPLTPITVKRGIHDDQVRYLAERQLEFPGVSVAQTYLREYPFKALGAHLLGHVGEVSQDQLDANDRLRPGDEVGQAGVESAYDRFLRGRAGVAHMRVDSLGRPRSSPVMTEQEQPGNAIRLTIDVRLQQAAERAIRYGLELARESDEGWAANGGAIVALDPSDGEVLAMASNPTYRPSNLVGRIDPQKVAPLMDEQAAKAANYPIVNRATAGAYPPGSIFKPVTALAAMEEHLVSPYSMLSCTPSYTFEGEDGVDYVFDNWTTAFNTGMTLPVALAASCNTYFYQLGKAFYDLPADRGSPLQAWASKFGFGQRTGIDVGPEVEGLLPTPAWRRATFTKERYPDTWELERLWKPGDSIQLAIGQKDMLVTPLQMARFYALIANGGKLVTPHVVAQAEEPGQNDSPPIVRQRFTPPAAPQVDVDPAALQVVRDGLLQASNPPYGTAAGVFGSFPVPIAGKTGTAQKVVTVGSFQGIRNQSWWCGYGPADDPEIVLCALIENGGHGGAVAAPVALRVFEEYFKVKAAHVDPSVTD
jgi:penicillin-binding protein 2